jgi:hypothetical protein
LNFGDLDYSRDDLATIDASLRMDRCIQVYWYNNFSYEKPIYQKWVSVFLIKNFTFS